MKSRVHCYVIIVFKGVDAAKKKVQPSISRKGPNGLENLKTAQFTHFTE